MAFFENILKVTILANIEERVVEVSGGGVVNPSELVARCVEHGLRVCREGPWQVMEGGFDSGGS